MVGSKGICLYAVTKIFHEFFLFVTFNWKNLINDLNESERPLKEVGYF